MICVVTSITVSVYGKYVKLNQFKEYKNLVKRIKDYTKNETKDVKYEHCVKEVKGQEGVNPYAVCHSSVYGKKKEETYSKKEPYTLKLDDEVNGFMSDLFKAREGALNKITATMSALHDSQQNKYPLLPLSNQMRNVVYNGLIGGKRRYKRYNRTYKRNNKKTKHSKTRISRKTRNSNEKRR